MKPLLITLLALPVFCFAQYTYKNLEVNYLENNAASATYTYENLRLYPLRAKQGFLNEFRGVGKYMMLQEAIANNKIKISEKSNSGTVNTLSIENLSGDTIIIITGDLVKGGKQDRIINTDMVLNPKSGKKDLPVFCVESGRWNAQVTTENNRGNNYSVSNAAPAEFKNYQSKGSVSLR